MGKDGNKRDGSDWDVRGLEDYRGYEKFEKTETVEKRLPQKGEFGETPFLLLIS